MEHPDRTDEEKQASARLINARAAIAELKLDEAKETSKLAALERDEVRIEYQAILATDNRRRTYRLLGSVNTATCKAAIDKMVRWHRIDPKCKITFVIDSPGGDIISGFHLFDQMLWLRREGHHITTIATGMAASMGGVLFQAGSERIMTPQASMLIHEAQFGTGGSFGQVEDEVEYVRMLQDRILHILAERSTLSKAQIKRKWARKNWWLMAEEAVKLGFADHVD